jgi:hypothetical protein
VASEQCPYTANPSFRVNPARPDKCALDLLDSVSRVLALKVRRHLEKACEKLEVTVEEGLAEPGTLSVLELVELPVPSARQKQDIPAQTTVGIKSLRDNRIGISVLPGGYARGGWLDKCNVHHDQIG